MLRVGIDLLDILGRERRITNLWDEAKNIPNIETYERFILGLDLLFWANRYGRKFNCEKEAMLRTNDTINSNVEVLKAKKEALELEIERDQKELSTFKVHAQYKELQAEAAECTRIIHTAVNKKAMLQQYLESALEAV